MAEKSDHPPPCDEPLPRGRFSFFVAGEYLYVWGGNTSERKRELASTVSRFHRTHGWLSFQPEGLSPPGLVDGAFTSDGHQLYTYGGHDGYKRFLSGSLNKLHLGTSTWTQLSPQSTHGPKRKHSCRMVAYQEFLVLFGGRYDEAGGDDQPGTSCDEGGYTNEQHIFDLRRGECREHAIVHAGDIEVLACSMGVLYCFEVLACSLGVLYCFSWHITTRI